MPDPGQKDALASLGERIRELRSERGLSQEALADLADLDRTYISSVERGRRNATVLTLHRIAGALGVDPTELLRPPGSEQNA